MLFCPDGYINPTGSMGLLQYMYLHLGYPRFVFTKYTSKNTTERNIGDESPIGPVTLSPRMKDWHCPAANVLNDLSPTMSAHDATEVPCHQPEFRGFFSKLWNFATYVFFSESSKWIIVKHGASNMLIIFNHRLLTLKYHHYIVKTSSHSLISSIFYTLLGL